ncbi:synaptotagmin-5 [Bacillus rossius redtenbacheri]|uniref:synaptotagmin-5 n=1 Tax=Bacillus rossius redtenbacheri TaxID=93214 RepID=UPI002FDF03FE
MSGPSGGGLGPAGCWIAHKGLGTWARMARERSFLRGSASSLVEEFEVAREQLAVQPVDSPALSHQPRSFPPQLTKTPSTSSQGSLDSTLSKQSHRGSSPQIRTTGPDGRHVASECRSPSPGTYCRAASLDARYGSSGDLRASSPSLTSLVEPGSACSSPVPPTSPRGAAGRNLSPLLLPSLASRVAPGDTTAPPASPLGTLQPDLYQRKQSPLFLGSQRSGPSMGRLHLALYYDFDKSDLHVNLIEARDLAGGEQGGFSDPYVRLSLSPPVDSRKRQTAIHRNDANPHFDEHFKFPVSHQDLQDKSLVLQVFDYDRFSRNDIVGEVCVNMDELEVSSSVEIWGEITKNKKPREETQEVLLSLSYLPSAERLTVVLLKARNLFLPQDKDSIDPFVKVYLLSGSKRVKKKKTATRKSSCNPVWNEALTFNVTSSHIATSAIEVCIMDQGNDLIGNNPLLGCCVIGPQESGAESDHWNDMTHCPRKAVAMWHTLR